MATGIGFRMNKDSLNTWLTLAANIGVLIGIIFLAVEIQQNTQAINRDIELSELDYNLGRFVESDHLPGIVEKIGESPAGRNSTLRIESPIMEEFGLSSAEASRWWRWVLSQWLRNEVDWEYAGRERESCRVGTIILGQNGNKLLWDLLSERNLSPEYIDCVQNFGSTTVTTQ